MFSEERVTQMAAYLLLKGGGRMPYIKLLKLLYIAERNAMAKWGESISGDRFVSMPHGPVLSQTYDLIQGHCGHESIWQRWICDESHYEVSLASFVDQEDLDELSVAELKVLDDVYASFGHMGKFQLVGYTHDNFSEWQDPNGSSYPIRPESILRAVGKSEEEIATILENLREQQQLENIRAKLR